MFKKKYDLAIINRSFWPKSEILGEAKLRLAEKVSETGRACVITQTNVGLEREAKVKGRGKGVTFYTTRSRSDSASSLLSRVFDAALFGPFVFWSLIKARPTYVYVSTNPPVVVPFLVFIYCAIFRVKYTYHLQDIHPEITNLVIPMNKLVFKLLRSLDNITLRHATSLFTLSEDMAQYLRKASNTKAPIHLVDNPSFEISEHLRQQPKTKDIIFCGNAGRVQRIPELLAAIRAYLDQGGCMHFSFAGGGVYAQDVAALANEYNQVTYHGYVKPSQANKLVAEHRWAILPIQDEVTKYAFPSKSSSYVAAGCQILAVCGTDNAVARWVHEHNAGMTVESEIDKITEGFVRIETLLTAKTVVQSKEKGPSISSFVDRVYGLMVTTGLKSSQAD